MNVCRNVVCGCVVKEAVTACGVSSIDVGADALAGVRGLAVPLCVRCCG